MKRNLCAAVVMAMVFTGVASAQGSASSEGNGTSYSQAQLKQMMRDAHTPDQYKVLAGYFAGRHEYYQQQASEEKKEWIRRSQNVMVVAAKYPRPVDSARYLYEYYTLESSEAGDLAAKYAQLASPSTAEQPK
jgi:hypothetical protein